MINIHTKVDNDCGQCVQPLTVMPDPLEHATGLERRELMALESGNDDPFNMKVLKKADGTRNNPTLVPSCFDARIVGCICEEHSTVINWLWVHKDHPRRCECGHWYKLIEKPFI
ncbi:cytochrome c oxidase subunit 5B, mitochondrial isoform X2 [Bicyclus anynana]|uniref:Cytochrome c oxidase subunit 5B, mitochondrial isoform X2 n=1 Tax=Bicyclus anynana TaxID=110368 RepID=A0ABM3LYP7_BICAN|nr:cytochrome c oxidase subunit 5B, mitochondrial isoform X2 [Bicyclus anynana]